ncbi:enoyl-CoA hydratase/isomerase family protein [Gemmatimonas sp.]|uniref:enoyl-CoA hydratase/isomerase family protein n=1 Tax=Gemmatimonas sp. TaxID=1962908 RepID=UPI0037BE7207
MTTPVQTTRDGDVLVVTIDHPPVNALSHAVRVGLMAAMDELDADTTLRAMVIASTGTVFIGGADIREFAGPRLDPMLNVVCRRLDDSVKPVVAAVQGAALGGGFEVALAAHYRVASPVASVAFPELLLGLLPGAGGTQRASRLAGAALALDLMLTGRRVSAEEAVAAGLLDHVHEQPLQEALAIAHQMAATPAPLRRARDGMALHPPARAVDVIAALRDRLSVDYPNLYSPARIVDCVEAAVMRTFDDGCVYEVAAFMDCLASPQRQALVHVFFAEREVRASEQSGVDLAALGAALREARDAAIAQLVRNGNAAADVYTALSTWGMSLDGVAREARLALETVNVCTHAMAVAARHALASGAARIPADCDVASIRHAGFPRYRGGVLWYAEHGAAITP